jgi:hypothetical protein
VLLKPNQPKELKMSHRRASVDRSPRFVIRMQANEHSIQWNGKVFDLSGLSLKNAAVIRYNVVTACFDKSAADKMVADYSKQAA